MSNDELQEEFEYPEEDALVLVVGKGEKFPEVVVIVPIDPDVQSPEED